MKLKSILFAAVLATSLLPVAYAAESGGVSIPMIAIPGSNYEMGKTEVTQGQWKAVMGENPSYFSKCGDDCPVEHVSWDDTKLFIKRLNRKTGKEYRLPTEAEWQHACLAGGNTTYCGGEEVDKLAWTENNSGKETSPVAGKKPNAWGLYDMSGNVWEWCEDWYDNDHKNRVLRGGSWGSVSLTLRAAFRYSLGPSERSGGGGFRLARTLP